VGETSVSAMQTSSVHFDCHRVPLHIWKPAHVSYSFILGTIFAAIIVFLGTAASLQAQENSPAAWRVECTGDGKTLECRALQQMIQREDKQLVAQLTARFPPDSKTPVMMIQLPLGLNVSESVELKVDNGLSERQHIQTCTATGCFAGMTLNDKFVAALRSGSQLKVTFQDSNKRPIAVAVPLLGFGLALDKTR
jgi:invasion protein IalB